MTRLDEVPVRRRDDADIHLDRIRSADALELVLLKHAEKFDLNIERNFADLIQENCPPRETFRDGARYSLLHFY
jgi:hypothetical protein